MIYKTVILLVNFVWVSAWSFALREEYRLKVFENRLLRKLLWPKRDKDTLE
jgi:hypothetical protein